MAKLFEKFVKGAKGISLFSGEKARIRERILDYAKAHSSAREAASRPYLQEGTLASIFYKLRFVLKPMPALAALLIFVAGTGIVFAAERSLPGDLLHPVKVNFNEPVKSVLAFGPEAKARAEIEKADQRLEEIEKLAAKGKLDSEKVENAKARFKGNVDKVSQIVSGIREKNGEDSAAGLQSNLETILLLHEGILDKIKTGEEIEIKIKGLRQEVRIEAKEAVEERKENEKKIEELGNGNLLGLAEGKLTAAENKIAEVRNFLELKKDRIPSEIMAEAQGLLASAEEDVVIGKAKMSEGKNGEALVILQQAFRLAQSAHQLAAISQAIKNIDIGERFEFREKIKFPEKELEIKIEKDGDGDRNEDRSGSNGGKDGEDDDNSGKDGENDEDRNSDEDRSGSNSREDGKED